MIKRRLRSMLCLLCLVCAPACAENSFSAEVPELRDPLPLDDLAQARQLAWDSYEQSVFDDGQIKSELDACALSLGDVTMRFTIDTIGDMPEGGYPLYIALHGGGSSDTPDKNDSQWNHMSEYYSEDLECGVYVCPRGVRDTWDTHFNPESYPLYDRLIRYMILTYYVNPNRVYLEGFSAGGDGVYGVSCRMPDRFAAVNMSSGHPNSIPVYNLYNLPIQLQAGEFDTAYNRHTVTAEYGILLDKLQDTYGNFQHRTLIHYDAGHNFGDSFRTPIPVMKDPAAWLNEGIRDHEDVDCFPPDYMDNFTRDPLPPSLIWDLTTRAPSRETEAFYYLSAPYSTDQGLIFASFDRAANTVTIDAQEVNGQFSILLNEKMVDFSSPVTFQVNHETSSMMLTPDRYILEQSTRDRGDPNFQFESMVTFSPQQK